MLNKGISASSNKGQKTPRSELIEEANHSPAFMNLPNQKPEFCHVTKELPRDPYGAMFDARKIMCSGHMLPYKRSAGVVAAHVYHAAYILPYSDIIHHVGGVSTHTGPPRLAH